MLHSTNRSAKTQAVACPAWRPFDALLPSARPRDDAMCLLINLA